MNQRESRIIGLIHIAFRLGIALDALAFVQMAFPRIGLRMLGASIEPEPAYVFAINLAAGLMLAWTLLLFWADRKPIERRSILPLTMIIIAWNVATMIYGVQAGLVPLSTLLPQIILVSLTFVYYGFCFIYSFRLAL